MDIGPSWAPRFHAADNKVEAVVQKSGPLGTDVQYCGNLVWDAYVAYFNKDSKGARCFSYRRQRSFEDL